MTSLTIRRPDDWHLHLRDGAVHDPPMRSHAIRSVHARKLVLPLEEPFVIASGRKEAIENVPEADRVFVRACAR